MAVDARIFEERDEWRRPLALSAVLHGVLFGSMMLYAIITGRVAGAARAVAAL